MDKHALPPELRDLATDEATAQDYERLWSLLQDADAADADASAGSPVGAGASFDVDEAWDDLAGTLDLDAGETETTGSDEAHRSPDRAPDRGPAHASADRAGGAAGRGLWTPVRGAAAALLVLAIGLAGVGTWWAQPVRVVTTAGEQATVTLPDGSTAQLNGATSLEYPRGFAHVPVWMAEWVPGVPAKAGRMDERPVTLRGEAYFSVTEGRRPFRVETANARVDVLGTAFNVRSRPQDRTPVTEVVVSSGRVRVSGRPASGTSPGRASGGHGAGESVVLDGPGRSSRLTGSAAPAAPETVDLKYAGAWRSGGFAVQNRPLPVILQELEVRFGTELRLADTVERTSTMTLHYARAVRLEDVLRDVCRIQGLSFRQTSDGYLLVAGE
jgi:transmembrane sensor